MPPMSHRTVHGACTARRAPSNFSHPLRAGKPEASPLWLAWDATASRLGLTAMAAIAGTMLWSGMDWVSTYWLPHFLTASWIALGLSVALLPIATLRRTRIFAGAGIVAASYVFGITAWLLGCGLTGSLWGGWALALGLLLFGGAVIPFALIAALLHGMWPEFALLLGLLVATLASALGGGAIAGSRWAE